MKYHRKAILGHFSHGEKFRSKKKSGWFDKTILAAGLLLLVFAAFSVVTKGNTFAAELNANISFYHFGLRGANGNISIMSDDHSTNPDDYNIKMADNVPVDMDISMSIELSNGRAIAAGDTLLIPVVTHDVENGTVASSDLRIGYFEDAKLEGPDDLIMGTVSRVENGFLIKFAPEASGLTSLKTSISLDGIARSDSIGKNRVGYVTIAGENFYFGVSQTNLTNLADDVYSSDAANNSVVWTTNVGSGLTNSLSSSRGTTGVATDLYVEQTFPGAVGFDGITIREAHRIPVSLSAQSNASSAVADYIDRTDKFTEVKQSGDEGYASFARRVMSRALQYGFYQDSEKLRLIVNYGALGVDTPFASAEAWAEDAADNAIAQGYYTASNKTALVNYFTDSFGANSTLQQSPSSVFDVRVLYPADRTDDVTTTAVIHDDSTQESYGSRESLASIIAGFYVDSGEVQLAVIDASDNAAVNGGLYKLQCKKDSDTFEDYAPTEDYENTKRVTKNGMIVFEDVESGNTCRIVGLEVPEGYDITASEGYNATDKVTYTKEFDIGVMEGARVVIRNTKIAVPEDDDDDDTPEAPSTGFGTADETSGSADAGIYAMTAFGIAMVVIAIKRKVSLN